MTKILLYNTRGIHNTTLHPNKTKIVLEIAKQLKADLLLLTETHTTNNHNPLLKNIHSTFANAKAKRKGVAVIPLNNSTSFSPTYSAKGRFLIGTLSTTLPSITLALLYSANDPLTRKTQSTKFFLHIPTSNTILAGDFNNTIIPQDRTPQKKSPDSSHLEELLNATNLTDPFPPGQPHTFFSQQPQHQWSSRLDRFYTSLENYTFSLLPILDPKLSDHSPVLIHISPPNPPPKGPAFWRINNTILTEERFSQSMHELLSKYTNLHPKLLLEQWDQLKSHIATLAQLYSKEREAKRRKLLEKNDSTNPTTTTLEYLNELAQRRLLHGRIKADKAKELPSAFLTHILNKNIQSNIIHALHRPIE
jgi:hypothetical protein